MSSARKDQSNDHLWPVNSWIRSQSFGEEIANLRDYSLGQRRRPAEQKKYIKLIRNDNVSLIFYCKIDKYLLGDFSCNKNLPRFFVQLLKVLQDK